MFWNNSPISKNTEKTGLFRNRSRKRENSRRENNCPLLPTESCPTNRDATQQVRALWVYRRSASLITLDENNEKYTTFDPFLVSTQAVARKVT
jgi:hypothetical protein